MMDLFLDMFSFCVLVLVMPDEDMYKMVNRWLSTTPQDTEKAITLQEASSEAILKAASLAKMSAFRRLTNRWNGIMDAISKKAVGNDLKKEIEMLRAIRQEAEQLFGPMARKEEVEAAPKKYNFQLAVLTATPSQIEEKVIDATVVTEQTPR